MAGQYKYEGSELELFQHAKNWKAYFSREIKPFIKGSVLETGAGLGATTILLNDGTASSWVLLEPDDHMAEVLKEKLNSNVLPSNCRMVQGTIDTINETFDTIIYIDVLEHIEDDRDELKKAASKLRSGGNLIVLSPAFQSLYNPFDKAIGHHRRYTRKSLKNITPGNLELIKCSYYDSTGFFAAAVNKLLLRKKYPTQKQVFLWDRWLIPVSRVTDKLILHSFGKSIIAVWRIK